MNIDSFEFGLIDFQSCNTWKQQFIDARHLLEQIEINRLEAVPYLPLGTIGSCLWRPLLGGLTFI